MKLPLLAPAPWQMRTVESLFGSGTNQPEIVRVGILGLIVGISSYHIVELVLGADIFFRFQLECDESGVLHYCEFEDIHVLLLVYLGLISIDILQVHHSREVPSLLGPYDIS